MNMMIAGVIMELGIMMNRIRGIEAQVLLHGNTGCICVIVSEDGVQAYENRSFVTNEKELLGIKQDMVKMKEHAMKERRRRS